MIKNYIKHFKLISTHKYYVFKNCWKAQIPWRGIKHDLSKFSPVEFLESARNYDGNRSPIDVCKEKYGWSKAWMHHKGRNKHHYEYWQDNFDKGGIPLQMPFKDALEMVCDYIGAGQAYMKKDFTYEGELQWWKNKIAHGIAMHPQTKAFVELMLTTMVTDGNSNCLKKEQAKYFYHILDYEYKRKQKEKNND